MKKEIHQKWLERVRYDMDTAHAMFAAERHIYAVFMCQQAIEKCFKALMAFKGIEIVPIHNLRRLAEMTGTIGELSQEDLEMLDFLSLHYLNARYKEDIEELSARLSADKVKGFLSFSTEKIEWLTRRIKP